ncbi:MAG: lipocalin family protein [Bacteroidales bacterium]|nr:lipocalin family protein [Bacteroidales bacterium]
MNIVRKMMVVALAAVSLLAVSCNKNEQTEPQEPQLEVTAHSISGSWELVKWNESALADGTYVYINFVRNDRTYTMYQNLDSFNNVPHVITGSYYIDTDVELGAVIRGNYDHDSGDWAHRYIVKSLTASTMVWVAKDDETFIQEFKRVDSIPAAQVED